jgi:hypothetical protein
MCDHERHGGSGPLLRQPLVDDAMARDRRGCHAGASVPPLACALCLMYGLSGSHFDAAGAPRASQRGRSAVRRAASTGAEKGGVDTGRPRGTSLELEATAPTHWYGWQILLADASAVSLALLAGVAAELDHTGDDTAGVPFGLGALATYLLGGPVIHVAHDRVGAGLGSLGLRLGLPLVGFGVGAAAAQGCDGFLCEAGGAALGGLVGIGAAIAIDAATLPYEPRGDDSGAASVVPLATLEHGRGWIGARGRF